MVVVNDGPHSVVVAHNKCQTLIFAYQLKLVSQKPYN